MGNDLERSIEDWHSIYSLSLSKDTKLQNFQIKNYYTELYMSIHSYINVDLIVYRIVYFLYRN
jgi:hypothetical protein